MYTEKKRVFILMLISVLMNALFFLLAYFLKLPLWLDTTGTIYASVLLGFPAGFVVAIINNFSQAFLFYGSDSLIFYIISAVTAFLSGCLIKNKTKIKLSNWFLLTISISFVCGLLSALLTFVSTNGVPSDFWGERVYVWLIANGYDGHISTIISVSVIKMLDAFVSVAIVFIMYTITPRVLKYNETTIKKKECVCNEY